MIWDTVTDIGIGVYGGDVVYDYNGHYFTYKVLKVVVQYYPKPNTKGQYTTHVKPPLPA